jgi:pyrophosphatase PpaX
MKDYDAYLFDADGTIIDTREMINSAYMSMADALGVTLTRQSIQETIGLPVDAQMRAILGGDHDADFYARGKAVYSDCLMRHYRDELKTFPGVVDGLRGLKARGKKLAVVTSRRLESLAPFLDAVGMGGMFQLYVTPESTPRHKPDPQPALFAMEKLGAGPDQCLFVGDATFDIECGHAAGMDTALVAWGMPCDGWAVKPDYVIKDVSEFLDY